MGKNRVIKILGNVSGNVVVHKILVKYTNKLESIHHLESEAEAYRDNALEIVKEFNWNEEDKAKIKSKALKKFTKDMKKYYKDVRFPMKEAEELIEEIINELIL